MTIEPLQSSDPAPAQHRPRAWWLRRVPGMPGLHGEIRSFTGLRGFAAVMVMLYHFGADLPPGGMTTFILRGYLWVDLFFVLSGFVMAYNYRAMFAGGYRLPAHLAFLGRRTARIYPLYIAVTLESAARVLWQAQSPDAPHVSFVLAANLMMVQAWGIAPSLAGATWSISTEWAAYLLFPLLAAVTLFSSRRAALAAAGVALVTVGFLAVVPVDELAFDFQGRRGLLDIYSSATPAPLLRCLAEFTLGLLVFRAANRLVQHRIFGAGPAALAAAAAVLLAVAVPGWDVAAAALFPVLLLCLSPQQGRLGSLLGARIPYRLGEWSYAIYLIHSKFTELNVWLGAALAEHLPFARLVAMALTSAAVIGCASVIHLGIELPCRRLLRAGLGPRTAPEASASR